MTIVAEHELVLTVTLRAANLRELDDARRELARRVAGVVPFARIHTSVAPSGRKVAGAVEVVAAEVRSPGLATPIRIVPRPREVRS